MGWTWTCDGKGYTYSDIKKELDEYYTWGEFEVLKSRMVGSTYYAAVRDKETGNVSAAVCLTGRQKGDWGYKPMDEFMGPTKAECPKAILNLLSPTYSEWANEWREKCKRAIIRKDLLKTLPAGAQIKFRWGKETLTLTKERPSYQFKKEWWRTENNRYFKKKDIPLEFEVVRTS